MLDVDINRKNGVTEAAAKEAVSIFVQIPTPYIGKIECTVSAKTVEILIPENYAIMPPALRSYGWNLAAVIK